MTKDAFYFPHFCNARNDSKLLKIRRILGWEGYGIYFALLEMLREQNDFSLPLDMIPEIEFEFRVAREKIETIIYNFDLFDIIDNKFFSAKLIEYMQPYLEKSERGRTAVNIRWEREKERKLLQTNNGSNTNVDTNVENFDTNAIQRKNIKNIKNIKNNTIADFENLIPESLLLIQNFKETWNEFSKYRITIKKPLTEIASKKALNFLKSNSEKYNPVKLLDIAIMNNWQGLYLNDDALKSQIKTNGVSKTNDKVQTQNYDYSKDRELADKLGIKLFSGIENAN